MPVSSEFLARAADETGFPADTIEKVVRLGELAANVARHPLLGKALVLKGGTALNLCWGPPKRLSVDLDYNFIGAADRAGMLEARPLVERTVEFFEAIGAGEFRPELLGDAAALELEDHPVIKWKLLN